MYFLLFKLQNANLLGCAFVLLFAIGSGGLSNMSDMEFWHWSTLLVQTQESTPVIQCTAKTLTAGRSTVKLSRSSSSFPVQWIYFFDAYTLFYVIQPLLYFIFSLIEILFTSAWYLQSAISSRYTNRPTRTICSFIWLLRGDSAEDQLANGPPLPGNIPWRQSNFAPWVSTSWGGSGRDRDFFWRQEGLHHPSSPATSRWILVLCSQSGQPEAELH